MLKKTIVFKDLDGNPVSEDFYFNLNKAELTEIELSERGGLGEYVKRLVATEDGGQIMAAMKKIVTMAVGKRSDDNRRFIKSQEIIDEFVQSDAYSEFFMELVTDAGAAAEFIRGIVPVDLQEKVDAGQPVSDLKLPDTTEVPAWIAENREPTEKELRAMTPEQMMEAFRAKSQGS